MASKTRAVADDDLRKLLIDRGLRVTSQRMVILRELARLQQPASHAELTERLTTSVLDRVTIYRNLVSLTERGIVLRSQLGDNIWRFELLKQSGEGHSEHPHFVCNECGSVACLPADTIALRGVAKRHEIAEVQLRGRCIDCVRA